MLSEEAKYNHSISSQQPSAHHKMASYPLLQTRNGQHSFTSLPPPASENSCMGVLSSWYLPPFGTSPLRYLPLWVPTPLSNYPSTPTVSQLGIEGAVPWWVTYLEVQPL